MNNKLRNIFCGIGVIAISLVVVFGTMLIYLSIREYKPERKEIIQIKNQETGEKLKKDQEISVLTWNVGYGALSETEDFFMDGGKDVRPESRILVQNNLSQMKDVIKKTNSKVVFLQEIDKNSKRSYHINEVNTLAKGWKGNWAYARNFLCDYIPYPMPTIGQVDAGLVTLNRFQVSEAVRYSLPTPFSWPLRVCQLKRCLLMERVPINGSQKEVVFVNLHLEAYDNGSGKKAQTRILAEILQKEYDKGNYVIAGGDFNQTFQQVDQRKYPIWDDENFQAGEVDEAVFQNGWKFATDDSFPTCRLLNRPYDRKDEKTQFYVIDGFIVSPNVEICNVTTLNEDFKNSDHNPVQIKIKLK